jgi:hypothetical protein
MRAKLVYESTKAEKTGWSTQEQGEKQ